MYGSTDGISFFRICRKNSGAELSTDDSSAGMRFGCAEKIRYLRLQILDCALPLEEMIMEVQVFGIFLGSKGENAAWMEPPKPFGKTIYAEPVTRLEVEDYLYGLVGRTVGTVYKTWFSFHLTDWEGNDSFSIYSGRGDESGKVCIAGNTGVAMAAGLNYYYKHFCNVNISQQERQAAMPPRVILPEMVIKRTVEDPLRYAYNYCTLSYTMPFWGEEEWQKELDWLALNGVNLLLDFTGIEAVWYQFLQKLGYTDREIRSWIVGPCYTAWQSMQNIEGFGGGVHPKFFLDRVELARRNQRKMRILGIRPILQGYAGMVPSFHEKHDPGASVFPQGEWNGIRRPSMLDLSTQKYKEYTKLFYEIQGQVYGKNEHYYAIDPFHEGGNRPDALNDREVSICIMENLLDFDPDAVWVVQAWRDNPTDLFLEGIKDYKKEHVLILDLSATDNPCHTGSEFQGTPWIYCMLDMYGGRLSTHGDLDALAEQIPKARQETRYMKGIGFTSEATCHNPVIYELLFEMAWEKDVVVLDRWIQQYAKRRYGVLTPQIAQGWNQLLKTAYKDPGYSHHGGYSQIFTYRPRLAMKRGHEFNELNSSIIKSPYYNPREFYLAVKDFCEAYEECKDNDCYIYDLQDLLRQVLNLLGTEAAFGILQAYQSKDITQFDKATGYFLELLDMCNELMQIREDSLLGYWTGQAEDCGKRYDDFSRDMFLFNAKALITTWGYKETYLKLADYAYRQYGELLDSYYKKRWEIWIRYLRDALAEGREAEEITPETWFQTDWKFVMNEQAVYARTPINKEPVLVRAMQTIVIFAQRFWDL